MSADPRFEWAVRHASLGDVAESGDACFVRSHETGIFVAVIDGLGHGPGAQEATDVVLATLREITLPVTSLETVFAQCHNAAKASRGAAMSAAWLDCEGATITWGAVGNVEAILVRASEDAEPRRLGILARGGVVGYRLPTLRVKALPLCAGDLLVFATDGIESSFSTHPALYDTECSAEQIARLIFQDAAKKTDDALIFAGRYRG